MEQDFSDVINMLSEDIENGRVFVYNGDVMLPQSRKPLHLGL